MNLLKQIFTIIGCILLYASAMVTCAEGISTWTYITSMFASICFGVSITISTEMDDRNKKNIQDKEK